MTLSSTACGHSLNWTAILGLLCILLTNHVTEGASYGESCDLPGDCQGRGQTCSAVKLCTCSEGFDHLNDDNDCQVSQTPPYGQEVIVPDFSFTSKSLFSTDMTREDLDVPRMEEIRAQLVSRLTELFMSLTGFKDVDVTYIKIREKDNTLEAGWTVKLSREDPKFANATPKEIGDILKPELSEASRRYKDVVHIDTSRRDRPKESSDNLSLGLGLGLGLGLPALILVVMGLAAGLKFCRRREISKKAMSISDRSSSCESGRSSKMEPDNYQYTVFTKDGYSLPSHYSHFVAPSVTGSSATMFMETSDKLPLHKSP